MRHIEHVSDGFGRVTTPDMVLEHLRRYKVPEPVARMGPDWRAKVGGVEYTEMWLRRYVQGRQTWSCAVCASQWANAATEEDQDLIRDLQIDLELLLAHARLVQETGEVVRKEGYVENP